MVSLLRSLMHVWGKHQFLIQNVLIAVTNTTSLPRTSRPKLLVKRLSWKYLNLRIRVERKLVEQNFSAKAIYELPYKVTMENKLRCFHYNVVHGILPTNSNLYKMKLRISPSFDRSSHPKNIYFTCNMNAPVFKFFGKE